MAIDYSVFAIPKPAPRVKKTPTRMRQAFGVAAA